MCHSRSQVSRLSLQKQRGYLMPLAIFILVAMGFFAATLSRTTAHTALSATQEGITLQAFYAAESGAQLAMSELFYDSAVPLTRLAVDSRCTALAINTVFVVSGLANCSVTVSCTCNYENGASCDIANGGNYDGSNGVAKSFYQLSSTGQCGPASLQSVRTIDVSARME